MSSIPKIYFFTSPEPDNYQDDIIPLAEGLNELNIPFYSLNNYWLQSEKENDYLFKSTPDVHFSECDIVIFPYTWFNWVTIDRPKVRRDFPKDLFQSGRKYKVVYFDFNDGYRTVSWEKEFRQFDAIFRCKYNEKMYHPANMIPWALGFSNRVLKMLSPSIQVNDKKYEVLSNFGASHPYEHQLRRKMRLEYLPLLSGSLKVNSVIDNLKIEPVNVYDKLMWQQTNQRHSAGYYDRLRNHLISLCFCGDLVSSLPYDPSSILMHGNKARIKRILFSGLSSLLWQRHTRIVQWDSWRFWETLVAKSVPVHINLVTHGVKLPVMPENKIHYIGVDLSNYRDSVDFMCEEKGRLLEIGARGHDWAMEHYSPIATARRFLMNMGYEI